MKIATWNINGVKARIDGLVAYLREAAPDVLCLQEIKSVDEGFPAEPIADLGYNIVTHGQKGFNGVAILSKLPLDDVRRQLPGDEEDAQARWIEATISPSLGQPVRVVSLYLPNGNPLGTEKFAYKLRWMERFERHAKALLDDEMALVLAGDYNVIPEPRDAKRPEAWAGDALFQPESRAALHRLAAHGLTDITRATNPEDGIFTFWDYQAGAFQKNDGIRIDFLMASPEAADRVIAAGTDRFSRAWEKPSDHIPVWVELSA